jgi:hypothetical protein
MKKNIPIYLYGLITILAGVFLVVSKDSSLNEIKFKLAITLLVGAFFAFATAAFRQNKQVQFAYHTMHAFAMLLYAIALLFFCNSMERFINFTFYLFIFYSFSEIILCSWIFNLAQKVVFKIVLIRVLLGLVVGIGAVIALNFKLVTLQVFGVLFIMVGANIMLYVPVMKAKEPIKMLNKEL